MFLPHFYEKETRKFRPILEGVQVSRFYNVASAATYTPQLAYTLKGLPKSTAATITKMNSSGSFVKRMTITKWKGYEIEGLHLMGDLYATYKTGTNVAKIYKIPM